MMIHKTWQFTCIVDDNSTRSSLIWVIFQTVNQKTDT